MIYEENNPFVAEVTLNSHTATTVTTTDLKGVNLDELRLEPRVSNFGKLFGLHEVDSVESGLFYTQFTKGTTLF